MKYGHVGRPTNEEVKQHKTKKILKIAIPVVLVLVLGLVLTGKNGLSSMMGNSTGQHIEVAYHDADGDSALEADEMYADENVLTPKQADMEIPKDKQFNYYTMYKNITESGKTIRYYLCYTDSSKRNINFFKSDSNQCKNYGFYQHSGGAKLATAAWNAIRYNTTMIHFQSHWTDLMTVTFKFDNGQKDEVRIIKKGTEVGTPATPKKYKYIFKGWYNQTTGATWEAGKIYKPVNQNMTVVAKWEQATIYNVTFKFDNGQKDEVREIVAGTVVGTPKAPTKSGYKFTGWYNQTTGATWEAGVEYGPINRHLSLIAKWEKIKQHKVTFKYDNGQQDITKPIDDGLNVNTPKAPTKSGYKFKGWLDAANNNMLVNPSTAYGPIHGDKVLTAKWNPIYKLTFKSGNGQKDVVREIEAGTNVGTPKAPTKSGYKFKGWYSSEIKETWTASSTYGPINRNYTFNASWAALHNVKIIVKTSQKKEKTISWKSNVEHGTKISINDKVKELNKNKTYQYKEGSKTCKVTSFNLNGHETTGSYVVMSNATFRAKYICK